MNPLGSNTIIYSTIMAGPCQIQRNKDSLVEPVVSNGSVNYHPSIHPSGQFMVYTSDIEGTTALYVKDLNHQEERPLRLIRGVFMQDKAVFSPDGRTLYFVATLDGPANIYSMPFRPGYLAFIEDATLLTKGMGGFSPAISPDGEWMAFSSNLHCLPPFPSGPILPSNYKAGNLYLMKLDGTYFKQVCPSDDWQGAPCWSQDGSTIYFYAVIEGKARLHRCDTDNFEVQIVKGLEDREILSSAFASDGRLLFLEKRGDYSFVASIDLKVIGLDYQEESSALALDLAIHPDGAIFTSSLKKAEEVFGEGPPSSVKQLGQGSFLVNRKKVTLKMGKKVNLIGVRGYFPNFIPQNNEIIAYKDFGSIYRIKISEGKPSCLFQFPEGIAGLGLSVSADGKSAVTAAGRPFDNLGRKHIYLIDLETCVAKNLTPESQFNNSFPSFTPKGDILFASSGGTSKPGQKNLYLMRRSGEIMMRLTHTDGIDSMPCMSSQGNKIVFISKRGEKTNHTFNLFMLKFDKINKVWRERCLLRSVESFAHPKFSPDSKNIVCSTGMYGLAEETPLLPVEIPQSAGEIIVFNLKLKKVERLTANMWENSLPHWS